MSGRTGHDSDMAACILFLAGPGGLFLNAQVCSFSTTVSILYRGLLGLLSQQHRIALDGYIMKGNADLGIIKQVLYPDGGNILVQPAAT